MKNFKKILATVLAVLFVASVMVVGVSAASSDKAWYKNAVKYLDDLTISSIGAAGGEEVSRDEFVTWVAKIESHQLIESAWKTQEWVALSTFDDVTDSEHKGAIGYSVGRGFIKGNGDGTFAPHATVTLGEAAAVIVRLMAYENRVLGETWEEQKPNYMFVANTFCGAFDKTFLDETGIYDPDHKLTKGEAAYILYTIMNGAAWADDEIDDEEWENLNLTSYGVDLGQFFANNDKATVKAQFVVANVPLKYTNTTQTFRRYDTYMSGATYDILYTQKLYSSSGILDTAAGKTVTLVNLATGHAVTLKASDFSALVKSDAGHGSSDDKTQALDYVEYGGVVTLSASKENKDLLALEDDVNLQNNNVKKIGLKVNSYLAADGFVGETADTLAKLKKGESTVGWKTLGAAATASDTYARLTETPTGWTNVKFNANGTAKSGSLVVGDEVYTVVTKYTGKANEVKVYAPGELFDDDGKLITKKDIVISVGQIGDTIYAGGVFDNYQKSILNLHRHVVATDITAGLKYYTRTGAGTEEDPYVYTEVDINKDGYDPKVTYYISTGSGFTAAVDPDDYTIAFPANTKAYIVTKVTTVGDDAATYDGAKTYYVKDNTLADGYKKAVPADFNVDFKDGVDYYVKDGDDYIVNPAEAEYDKDTTYYLQKDNFETEIAPLSAFDVEFAAGTKYYERSAEITTYDATVTKYYVENADEKLIPFDTATLVTKFTTGKTYYTITAAAGDVDVAKVGKAYYLDEACTKLAEKKDFTITFKGDKVYKVYDAYNKEYVAADTTAFDPEETYYVYTEATATTAASTKEATLADFNVAFTAGTNYWVATAVAADAEYDNTKTYYFANGGESYRLATGDDFRTYFTAGTNYYTVAEAEGEVDVAKVGTSYYLKVGSTYVLAEATDFDVDWKDGINYYTYDADQDEYNPVDTDNTEYDPEGTYFVESQAAGHVGEMVLAKLKDFAVDWDDATYYEATKVNTATTAYDAETTYYIPGTEAGTLVAAKLTDFTVFFKLKFTESQKYYEFIPLTNRFGETTDTEVDITKTYYVESTYDEFFNGNTVKTSFQLTETIPSFVSYIYAGEGSAFVTNQNFATFSSFVVNGYIDTLTIDATPLSVADAYKLILAPAQGESNVIFSDTDGDGAYDVAVVTESNRALYYKNVNDSHDPASGGDLASDDAYTREVYDAFGNFIMSVEGLKSHNIGGIAVGYKVANGGTKGTGSDGWYVSTTATNKVTVVVTANNERQFRTGGGDTHQYGLSNLYPYTPTGVDIADLTVGYIEHVVAGTTTVANEKGEDIEVYTAHVVKTDGESTTVYIPVDPAEKITLPVTLDGITADVTFMSGRSLLGFVTEHVAADEIGTRQPGSWMAGHTVKYAVDGNGVAWCMVDTAVKDAVTGYVTDVTKTDEGDNTYKVTVVATTSEGSSSVNGTVDYNYVASNIKNGASMAAVITSFGIDAIFNNLTVKVAKVTGDLSNWSWKMDTKGADGKEAIALGAGTYGVQMTGLYYGAGGANGATVPEWKQSGNQFRYDDSSATKNQKFEQGTYISYADYQYIIKDQYKNLFTVEEIESEKLFGFLKNADFSKLGYYNTAYGTESKVSIAKSTTSTYIGGSVKALDVKGSATAVWEYTPEVYALVNSVLVKGNLVNSSRFTKTDDGKVVSQKDLVYLTFTKDASVTSKNKPLYTIGGLADAEYTTVEAGEGTAFFRANYAVFTKGGNRGGWRGDTYFGLAKQLYATGAGDDAMWTNVGDFDNAYILGYTKIANSKTAVKNDKGTEYGYYELYNMIVGYDPYYIKNIDNNGKVTYTLMFSVVKQLKNVRGYYYYQVDANSTLLIALINQSNMKQEVDDGKSYTDTSVYYVDPTTKLVYLVYGDAKYDNTKTTAETPAYVTTYAEETGEPVEKIAAPAIKAKFGLEDAVEEDNLVTFSVVPFTEDEQGYVPGLYHAYLTNGLGSVKSFQINQNVDIVVVHPNSDTGNFDITTTSAADLYASDATIFITDYQYDGTNVSCTMLSAIGKVNKPVQKTVDTNDTVSGGTKLVYLNADATVIAEAIQLGNYWVIRSTESAKDITTGEEVGSIQFVFPTYKEDQISNAKVALQGGGYFLINSDNEVISAVAEKEGKYSKGSLYAQVLTGTITGVTADGKTTATIKGVKDTDISGYNFKFIYHDTEGKNFGIGGKSTSVSILTTGEIEATWATDLAIVKEGVDNETHFYLQEDVDAAAESVAKTKAESIDKYLNGTFWNVEFSPLYNYFVSQRISYQQRKAITLTFNYVVINNVYYVFVNSFAK